jgi:hypothetical protein
MSLIRRCPHLGQGRDASAIRGYGAEQLHNEPLERREGLTAGVGAAVATFGLTVFMPRAAKSLPLADIEAGAVKPQDIVEEASVTVHVHPASSPSPLALLVAQGTSRVWLALAGHTKNGRYWHKVDQLDALLRPLLTQSKLFVRCWSLRDFVFE